MGPPNTACTRSRKSIGTGWWDSPRQKGVHWAQANSVKAALSRPAHTSLTQTVGRFPRVYDWHTIYRKESSRRHYWASTLPKYSRRNMMLQFKCISKRFFTVGISL